MTEKSPTKAKPVTWNNVRYQSISAAAKAAGITPAAMRKRLRRGRTCDADLNPLGNAKPCTWNGEHYSSIKAAAKANGVSESAMHYRLNQGYTCDADMRRRRASDDTP